MIKGRGTSLNPTNRFESLVFEEGELTQYSYDDEPSVHRTQFFIDPSRTILSSNDSPDVGFEFSINPYRGCEHGCVYCFARPTHEYLGMSAGLDFEKKILVKTNAAQLLREKLASPSWTPQPINVSGVTDCYQPIERKLQITRQCLEVLRDFRNPFTIITKNSLVTRDLDILAEMAKINGVAVFMSVTTLDPALASVMEPRTSHPASRLKAIETLAKAGVPVGAMTAPLIPGLNDHELPRLLESIAAAGAQFAGYVTLRLPYVLDDLFINWLETHFPLKKEKVLHRIREIRGGKLNDANFGSRMKGEGQYAEHLRSMFHLYSKKYGLNRERLNLSMDHFRRVSAHGQMDLFGQDT